MQQILMRVDSELKTFDVDDLEPLQGELKKLSDENFNKLRKSLIEKGFKLVLHVWQNGGVNYLIDGHQRVHVLQQLKKQGYDVPQIPCAIVQARTYSEAKETVLLAVSQYGKIDQQGFEDFIDGEDFDLGDFDFPDFNLEIPEIKTEEDLKKEEIEDDVPDIPEDENPYNVEIGQIWKLGRHRLMCGDSTSSDDFAKLMNGEKADITFTSPPYNVGSLNVKGNKRTKAKYTTFDDNQTEDNFLIFLTKNLNLLMKYSEDVFYNIGLVENNKRVIIDVQSQYKKQFKDIIYWKKKTVAPHIQPGFINNLVEFILCFGDGKRKFKNAQFSQGSYWNVIEGNNASFNGYSDIHKATLPLYLPENIIVNFCPKEGSVIECFGGTGTTLIAAEKLRRKCFLMEIDIKYVNVIIKRWEEYTGEIAERIV